MKEVIAKIAGIALIIFAGLIIFPVLVNLIHLHEIADKGIIGAWIALVTGHAHEPDAADLVKIIFATVVFCLGIYMLPDTDSNNAMVNTAATGLAGGGVVKPNVVALRSVTNSKFVTARNAGADVLAAEAGVIRDWEHFTWNDNSDGTVSLKAECNGKFVTVLFDDQYHPLVARADVVDEWEKFTIEKGNGFILLKTVKDGLYIQSDLSNGGILRAKEQKPQGWEQFCLFDATTSKQI